MVLGPNWVSERRAASLASQGITSLLRHLVQRRADLFRCLSLTTDYCRTLCSGIVPLYAGLWGAYKSNKSGELEKVSVWQWICFRFEHRIVGG